MKNAREKINLVLLVFVVMVAISFFNIPKSLALDVNTSTLPVLTKSGDTCFNTPKYACLDTTGFTAARKQLACETGLCNTSGANVLCCRVACETGETCSTPSSTLTCTGRGNCAGAQQCCKPKVTPGTTTPGGTTPPGGSTTPAPRVCGPTEFCNPLKFSTVEEFLTAILSTVRQIIVLLALVMIVVGAVMYVISAGNDGRVKTAKNMISAAVIGLALGIAAPSFLKEVGTVIGWSAVNNAAVTAAPTLTTIALNVLSFLLSTLGILAMVMLIIGAGLYVASAGDDNRVKMGKNIFKASLLGVVIAMSSLILVRQIGLFFGPASPSLNSVTPVSTSEPDFVGPPAPSTTCPTGQLCNFSGAATNLNGICDSSGVCRSSSSPTTTTTCPTGQLCNFSGAATNLNGTCDSSGVCRALSPTTTTTCPTGQLCNYSGASTNLNGVCDSSGICQES